jgi:hypothetical protein
MKITGTEDSVMNPQATSTWFDKGTKNVQWRKDTFFNKCCWENWISAWRKVKLDPYLSSCASINWKWIKYLNIGPETLKLVQEKVQNTLELISISNDFLNRTQMTEQLRDKWDYKRLKSSAQQKKWSLNWKCSPQNGRKSLPAIHLTRVL